MPLGSNMLKMSSSTKAYIAGIVDGEGCIGIYRMAGKRNRKEAARLCLRLIVGSTTKPLLDWLQLMTGIGTVTIHGPGDNRRKPSWDWQVRGRQAVELLFQLASYVIVKERQIHIACEFMNTMGPVGRHELSERTVIARKKVANAMRLANQRGPNHAAA